MSSMASAKDCPDFVCPEENGNFADPCTCRRFYICAAGSPTRSLCPTNLYWDDERQICTYKNEAKCGPIERKKKEDKIEIPTCDPETCQLPYCYCSKTGDINPFNDEPATGPQIISLMFDGAVNTNNFKYYKSILNIKKSNTSDECPIRATFFMTHNYNNYHQTEYFYHKGHEMAVSSVTGESLQFANESTWRKEISGMWTLLEKYANVDSGDVLGVRAPRFRPGFDTQFQVLVEEEFVWDSSISTKKTDLPIWPYTLDYRIPHKCKIDSCPTKAYPGIWELPANIHYIEDQSGGYCSYLDQCVFAHFDETDIYSWLKEDFLRYYESNRAPYMLPFHTNWFTHPHQVRGLARFIRWTLTLPDIHYLTATEVLLWMTEPEVLTTFKRPCIDAKKLIKCSKPTTCVVSHEQDGISELRYMPTCNECPEDYPWI